LFVVHPATVYAGLPSVPPVAAAVRKPTDIVIQLAKAG